LQIDTVPFDANASAKPRKKHQQALLHSGCAGIRAQTLSNYPEQLYSLSVMIYSEKEYSISTDQLAKFKKAEVYFFRNQGIMLRG